MVGRRPRPRGATEPCEIRENCARFRWRWTDRCQLNWPAGLRMKCRPTQMSRMLATPAFRYSAYASPNRKIGEPVFPGPRRRHGPHAAGSRLIEPKKNLVNGELHYK